MINDTRTTNAHRSNIQTQREWEMARKKREKKFKQNKKNIVLLFLRNLRCLFRNSPRNIFLSTVEFQFRLHVCLRLFSPFGSFHVAFH